MKLFFRPKKVKMAPADIEHALAFAQQVVPTVNYLDSNQSNQLKILDDHFVSKIGEEAVRKVFVSLGCAVVGPDYDVYEGRRKSWAEDLFVEGTPLAVKTQKRTAANRYGLSWTFQNSPKRRDPVLQSPDAWVCFVLCNDHAGQYDCVVLPPVRVGELRFREPRLAHLKGKKKVVYFEDLKPRFGK
ncbi:MAG: hypothetical protein D6714_09540 [Bacteroidetes bacterium]|nr:MAG: hypothetical protein D6714_09540 [Bacteroidota bacterium]